MKTRTFTKDDLEIMPFDISEHLDDEDMIAGYLSLCLEDPNPNVFLGALGDVAKARGMTELARTTGLSRESLYKSFKGDRKPQFETVQKIARACGLKIRLEPEQTDANASETGKTTRPRARRQRQTAGT